MEIPRRFASRNDAGGREVLDLPWVYASFMQTCGGGGIWRFLRMRRIARGTCTEKSERAAVGPPCGMDLGKGLIMKQIRSQKNLKKSNYSCKIRFTTPEISPKSPVKPLRYKNYL